jgi:hypothetical protein
VEQWPTEASGVTETRENRSLEGQNKTYPATSDYKHKRIDRHVRR